MGVVTAEHAGAHTQFVQFGDRLAAVLAHRVGHSEEHQCALFVAQHHHALALAFQCLQALFQLGRAQPEIFDQAMVAQIKQPAIDPPSNTLPRQRRKILDLTQGLPLLHCVPGQRPGNRVIRARGQARRPSGVQRFIHFQQVEAVGLHRLAMGQRAGLVQRQQGQMPPVLQIHTTLDQDALTRSRRQATDDGHRGGNHQRTGAGHHQQDQGAVDPVEPGATDDQRRHHGHRQGECEHHRGIDARELIDETLGRRARALRLLHRMDDACQGGVTCCRAYAELQRARLVDGASEHRVAHTLFHRQAFPGDRRLIDRRAAADHLAIETDALTGAHTHHRAQPDSLHVDLLPTAIGLLHGSARRRQIHQPANRIARPIQRTRLDQFGQGEQHHDHRRFRPLTDQHRAGHGDAHQGIDIEVAVLQGDPALLVGVQPAHQDGGNGQQCHQPVGAEPGEMHDFRSSCHPTSQRQRPPRFFCRCSSRLLRSAIIFDLRGEPQRADGRQHLRQHSLVMTDGEHALQQIEMQTGHAR